MGRESRLATRPGPIDNRGGVDRVEEMIGLLLIRLKDDPRVVAHYTAWFHRRDLGRLMTVPVSDQLPDLKAAAWKNLIEAVCRPPSEAEIATVLAVLGTMGPARTWPRRWAATALLSKVWPAAFYNVIQRPDLTNPLWVTVRDDGAIRLTYGPDPPQTGGRWVLTTRGNRPQAKGYQKLRDAFETWWLAYLHDPPVPKPVLTKKYAERENRVTDPHSVVDDRIELVETLLNRVLED